MMIYRVERLAALIAGVLFALSASAQEVVGDVVTTVADEGESGMFLATLCPTEDVAVDKDEAELFSIYTDSGDATLMKMRVRDGKYIVKAGDCVIVKTPEAKAVPLEETSSSRSSVWINDLFCPSEDMSVEDFCSSHLVAEGECIYLLTNQPANGGFGFTKFAGDRLRKGFFYIVTADHTLTSIESHSLARSREKASATYTLQGYPKAPAHGQLYIQNGQKFVAGKSQHVTAGINDETRQDSEGPARMGTRAMEEVEDGDIVPFLEGEAGNDDGFITPTKSLVRGDANGDSEVDMKDVEAVSAHIIGSATGSFLKAAADVNADKEINVADIVGIVGIIKAKS